MKEIKNISSFLETITLINKIPFYIFDKNGNLVFKTEKEDIFDKIIIPFKEWFFKTKKSEKYFVSKLTFLEYYLVFSFEHEKETYYLFGGPNLLYFTYDEEGFKSYSFSKYITIDEFKSISKTIGIVDLFSFYNMLRLTIGIITNKIVPMTKVLANSKELIHDFEQDKFEKLTASLKKDAIERAKYSYKDELRVLNIVKNGDLEAISNMPQIAFTRVDNVVKSDFKNSIYMGIAIISIVSRAAIEGGLSAFDSLSKSDQYIVKIDNAVSEVEISIILKQALYDFTYEVYKVKKSKKYSHSINQAIMYINENFQSDVSLESIADYVGLNSKYLSRLFYKEVGVRISHFIRNLKIDEAKNLLIYTNEDYTNITYKLNFPSQSYFVEVFKKSTGLTPRSFREKYSKVW